MNCTYIFMLPYFSISFIPSDILSVSITLWETSYLMLVLVLMVIAIFFIPMRDKALRAKYKHPSFNYSSVAGDQVSSTPTTLTNPMLTDLQRSTQHEQAPASGQIQEDVSNFAKKIPA